MTSKLTQWSEAHTAEHGAYAVLAGFEAALRAHNEVLATWYGEADIDEQLALFGWVTDLLAEQEAAEETMTDELDDLRERVMAQLRPEGLMKPPAAEPPIAQALHRAVVARLTEARDAARAENRKWQDCGNSARSRILKAERMLAEAIGYEGLWDVEVLAELASARVKQLGQERDAARAELAAESKRLADLERLWTEACEIAKTHCPCDVGRSYITHGIPRLAARAAGLERALEAARAEAKRAEGLRYTAEAQRKNALAVMQTVEQDRGTAWRDRDAALARLRAVAQTLIAAVGAEGPCDAEAAAERIVARLALAEREVERLRERLGEAQTDRDPKAWRHEVGIDDPENPLGGRGMVACAVGDIGHADRGVLLEPEVPLVERRHLDAARALVTRLTAERDEAWKTVELRDGIIADHQATEAAIAALLDEGTCDMGIRLDGEYRSPLGQRVNLELQAEYQRGRTEGVTSGRAAVIVEAVDLLGKDLERQSGPVRGTTVYCIEQLKGITPWATTKAPAPC